tara:strand:- start:106725 stop:107384 length:660 start_codon:yes stop_codon:yes gene_type:complete
LNDANQTPNNSDQEYYGIARTEVFDLLPQNCSRILELGVGMGATMAALRKVRDISFAAGVELMPEIAERARTHIDEVLSGDIETLEMPQSWTGFDLILCLDVLEHLADPWTVVRQLHERLAPGGVIVASLPNVNHVSVSLPLFFRGEWELKDAGILDRTHLRFFVKKTAIELMTSSGLSLQATGTGGLPKYSKRWWQNRLSGGLFERFLATQYFIRVGA